MTFLLAKAFNPSSPFSFPYPDFLIPPNGRCFLLPAIWLIKTIPQSSFFAASFNCNSSSHQIDALSPKSLLLAIAIASSASFAFITPHTGPKVSSLHTVISSVISTKSVGSKNWFLSPAGFHPVRSFHPWSSVSATCLSRSDIPPE